LENRAILKILFTQYFAVQARLKRADSFIDFLVACSSDVLHQKPDIAICLLSSSLLCSFSMGFPEIIKILAIRDPSAVYTSLTSHLLMPLFKFSCYIAEMTIDMHIFLQFNPGFPARLNG
jgi:hypothetical protein